MSRRLRRRSPIAVSDQLRALNPLLAQVYAKRGITSEAELSLRLEHLIPPAQLSGLDAAVQLLADALAQNEPLLIVGDFDADGATSVAVAMTILRQLGGKVGYLVPNRFDYGYGLTPEIVELAAQQSPSVIMTVDNGISSVEGVERATQLGIRCLITDHHLPGATLPAAEVIVNPNMPGCTFPSKNLAGVGVIFYVLMALRSKLRDMQWFSQRNMAEPALAEVLDLVALGTVADVVPLDRNNRILVQQGLLRIRAGKTRPGIRALLQNAGRKMERMVASDFGFAVAPRLNAAGRLDDMSIGIECLLAEDDARALSLAQQLDGLNQDRRMIESNMQREALALLDETGLVNQQPVPAAICLYNHSWHQGVVGILASRIKDRLYRPTIAFADGEAGEIKGSARSIPGFHIRDALDAVATAHPGLISKFGGHAMAAGLSLSRSDLEQFDSAFVAEAGRQLDATALEAVIESDGELASDQFELSLAQELRYAGPWGQRFPEPVFDGVFKLVNQRIVGERHLKLVLTHPENPRYLLDAIAFGVDLEVWPSAGAESVHIAYRLDVNEFRGQETLQLLIEYIEIIA